MEDGSGGIILQVAADLYGKKENVYVELRDGVPGLETVVDIVELDASGELHGLRSPEPLSRSYQLLETCGRQSGDVTCKHCQETYESENHSDC
eukprot:gene21408-32923_t